MAPAFLTAFAQTLSPAAAAVLTGVGLCGAAMYLAAFILLQTKRIEGDSLVYCGLNVAGALLVLISLCAEWSTPTAINNTIWLVIATYGMRPRRARRDIAVVVG